MKKILTYEDFKKISFYEYSFGNINIDNYTDEELYNLFLFDKQAEEELYKNNIFLEGENIKIPIKDLLN